MCVCGVSAILIAPAGAATPAPVAVGLKLIAGAEIVGAGSSASYTAACPRATPHPIGGQFDSVAGPSADQLALSASYPVGTRSWRVEMTNLGQTAQMYRALVVCVGAPGIKVTYPRGSFTLMPGSTSGVTVNCPRGTRSPLGGLFSLIGAPATDAVVNWIALLYKYSRLTGAATVGVRSLASTPVRFSAGIVCSNLLIANPRVTRNLPAAKVSAVNLTCPQGGYSVGGTFAGANPSDNEITLAGSEFQSARAYTLRVRSLATYSQRYVAGTVCIDAYLPSG